MTDDNNARYRPADSYGRAPASGGQGGDPLAELARLIGQSDPFSEFTRDVRSSDVRDTSYGDQSHGDHAREPAATAWSEPAAAYQPEPYRQPSAPAPDYEPPAFSYPSQETPQGYVEPQAYANSYVDPHHSQPGAAAAYEASLATHSDHSNYATEAANLQSALNNEPTFAAAEDAGHQFYPRESDAGKMPAPHDDEFYDDAPPSRRRGLVTVVAVFALAVVGSAGAFGYRTVFGSSNTSSAPPLIRASSEPTKIAPPPTASNDPAANKLSYDRFGDRGQNEQVVGREEKPVDMRDIARASAPPPSISAPATAATGSNPPSVLTEPKRVRTVPIRPDQTEAAQRPQTVAPSTTRSTVFAAAPSAPLEVSPPAAAARAAAPPPPPRVQPQAAPPLANSPLSLNPDSSPAPRDAAPPPPTRVASAPAAAAGNGRYLVQVSSQRSEADAQSSYRSIKNKYASVLGDRPSIVRRADLGDKGTYYRAMVGPFGTRDEAIQLCTSLKAAGGACVVQGN